jgi:RNA polymerase sigma-70 factor (ECF subfamily)
MADPQDVARDAALVMAARAGEQSAYAQLLQAHRAAVFRVCRNHLGEEAEALDLTQEAFASAFAALASFDVTRSFRTWILRIAVNKCHDWARRRKVRRFFAFAKPLDAALHIADPVAGPEDALAHRQEVGRLRHAIASLPTALKEPLILFAIEGLSQAETADVLGMTQKAVELRVGRAKRRLREIMEG